MRVIHLARKPLSEKSVAANVLKHGTGALNIDPVRIGATDADRKRTDRPASVHKVYDPDANRVALGKGVGGGGPILHGHGRWPANLIFQHRDECRRRGTKQVKGDSRAGNPESTSGRREGGFGDVGAPAGTGQPNARVYGDEPVAVWECVPGCPVADLDGSVGLLTSGSGTIKQTSGSSEQGNQAYAFGAESRSPGSPQIFYGDSGGASRFFKQVGGSKE